LRFEEDMASHLPHNIIVGAFLVQAVQKARQLQARVDVLAAQAADAAVLRQKLEAAEAQATASRTELAALQRFKADHTSAAAAAAQRQQQLAQQLCDAQQDAESLRRHAEVQAAEAAAARMALQGLLAEVDASQNAGDASGTLRWDFNVQARRLTHMFRVRTALYSHAPSATVEQLHNSTISISRRESAPHRERLASAEEENAALRSELSALHPEFFELVEDLKWDHHQLRRRAAQYEGLIAGLAAELGRVPADDPVLEQSPQWNPAAGIHL
jgi:hypothetical protein